MTKARVVVTHHALAEQFREQERRNALLLVLRLTCKTQTGPLTRSTKKNCFVNFLEIKTWSRYLLSTRGTTAAALFYFFYSISSEELRMKRKLFATSGGGGLQLCCMHCTMGTASWLRSTFPMVTATQTSTVLLAGAPKKKRKRTTASSTNRLSTNRIPWCLVHASLKYHQPLHCSTRETKVIDAEGRLEVSLRAPKALKPIPDTSPPMWCLANRYAVPRRLPTWKTN